MGGQGQGRSMKTVSRRSFIPVSPDAINDGKKDKIASTMVTNKGNVVEILMNDQKANTGWAKSDETRWLSQVLSVQMEYESH
jgi:hypothetical protein